MYNILIALVIAIAAWIPLPLLAHWPWYTGILPAIVAFAIAMILLSQRTARAVQVDMASVTTLFQEIQGAQSQEAVRTRLDLVRGHFEQIKQRHGRWQLFLDRQIDAQIGMLDYMSLNFDAALPRLDRSFRDWASKVMAGCVHYRRDRLAQAWSSFDEAASYAPKEPTIYVIWGTLQERKGNRDEALETFARGLEQLPDNALLRQLKNTVANKQRLDTERLGELWQRFFPEEVAQQMMVRGRRGPPVLPPGVTARPVQGPPQPRPRGKLARRR